MMAVGIRNVPTHKYTVSDLNGSTLANGIASSLYNVIKAILPTMNGSEKSTTSARLPFIVSEAQG